VACLLLAQGLGRRGYVEPQVSEETA